MNPLVSVVTPVYNGEKFLAECIESVLAQTYERWEYVILDNRSTDRTGEIARAYAERDSRIQVHTNDDFLDIIQNWNAALRLISPDSTYCKVIHADDLLMPACLSRMVELAEAHPSVGLVSSYIATRRGTGHSRGVAHGTTVVPGRDVCRMMLLGGPYVFGSPSSTMIRSDIVRASDRFYNEDNLHADTEVCFELLQKWDFGFVHEILTSTRAHAEQMTSTARQLNTLATAWVIVVVRYGSVFLTRDEFARRLAWKMWTYGLMLAKAVVKLGVRDRRFRRHHGPVVRFVLRSVKLRDVWRGFVLGLGARLGLVEKFRPVESVGHLEPER